MTEKSKIKCKGKSGDANTEGACETTHSTEKTFAEAYGGAKKDSIEKVDGPSANHVSKEMTSNLTREEKGVVSSVFAKVIEGAEIL